MSASARPLLRDKTSTLLLQAHLLVKVSLVNPNLTGDMANSQVSSRVRVKVSTASSSSTVSRVSSNMANKVNSNTASKVNSNMVSSNTVNSPANTCLASNMANSRLNTSRPLVLPCKAVTAV